MPKNEKKLKSQVYYVTSDRAATHDTFRGPHKSFSSLVKASSFAKKQQSFGYNAYIWDKEHTGNKPLKKFNTIVPIKEFRIRLIKKVKK